MFDNKKKHLEVVCAIILDESKVFATRRKKHDEFEGLWEFPGGKIEPNETKIMALKREIQEELAAEIDVVEEFKTISFEYENFTLNLYPYLAKFTSSYALLEHSEGRFYSLDELKNIEFVGADKLLVNDLVAYLTKNS